MKRDYCRPCAEEEKQKNRMTLVYAGRDNKITCAVCGRRRYGATYDVQRKET